MGETSFEREVLDRLTRIEVKTDGYDKLKEVVYQNQSDVKDALSDITELKDRNKWLARAIGGASITAFVGIVALFIKIGMGV